VARKAVYGSEGTVAGMRGHSLLEKTIEDAIDKPYYDRMH